MECTAQVEEEVLDASVANLAQYSSTLGLQEGDKLPRGGERVSLTVRRVGRVLKNILRLGH